MLVIAPAFLIASLTDEEFTSALAGATEAQRVALEHAAAKEAERQRLQAAEEADRQAEAAKLAADRAALEKLLEEERLKWN